MLTLEQIKKFIEIAKPDNYVYFPPTKKTGEGHFFYKGHHVNMNLYQDIIDGINANTDISIKVEDDLVRVKNKNTYRFFFHTPGNSDQAKEQALIYILDNIQKQD